MATSDFIPITPESQVYLISYLNSLKARYTYYYSIRAALQQADLVYYREQDKSVEHKRAQLANNLGDMSRFQDVEVPLAFDQVESWVSFMTDVFLSSSTIFDPVACPQYKDAAKMLKAVIKKQQKYWQWKKEFIKFFRNNAKYSLGALEVTWDKVATASIKTDIQFSAKHGKPENVIAEGNRVRNMDMYNTFWDTTVAPDRIPQDAEYVGYHELITRNAMHKYIATLGDDVIKENITAAYTSPTMISEYWIPQINPNALATTNSITQGQDWFSFMGLEGNKDEGVAYKGQYLRTTLYARIIPSDFNINAPDKYIPQVWKLVFINFSVLIYAEKQDNAHDMIPVVFGCPNDDGIKYQVKSLLENVKPFQQLSSTVMNSEITALRRSISDRVIYNPVYLDKKAMESPNPTARIPIKPTGYLGVPINEMIFPIPFNDSMAGIRMQTVQTIAGMANQVSGMNNAQRGQFVKGNKTGQEFNTVMDNADSKSRTQAIALEDQVFEPIKQIVTFNILQYQGTDSIYHHDTKETIKVDPVVLRNAVFDFNLTDGESPADKEMAMDAWQVGMQAIMSNQQIGSAYNIGDMVSYLMLIKGADVDEFKKPAEQIAYEQAIQSWQQTVLQALKQNPDITQDKLPPQPKPADYNLGPDMKPISGDTKQEKEEGESLIAKILEVQNKQGAALNNGGVALPEGSEPGELP